MSSMEDEPEPPGTEAALVEFDTQMLSQNDKTDESIPSQEAESIENDSADPNSSFEKRSSNERERRSRSRKERSSRHGKSRRKHHSSRHSKRSSREEVIYDEEPLYIPREEKIVMTAMEEKETEDGEILEDGEIASDDDELPQEKNIRRSIEADEECSDGDQAVEEQLAGNEDAGEKPQKEPKAKRDNKRKRKEKRKDDKRKKPRRHDYIDHDRVNEDEGGRWPGYQGGPDDDYYHGMGRRRDPRSMYYYNGTGDSPPGLYDSPSDDSDEDMPSQPSLTSLVSGDFLDASVAANEKEHIKMRGMKSSREKKRAMRGRRKGDNGGRHSEPPKKKLIEIPMAERPVCKFYKDGKCAKGLKCPFNHDTQRNRRLECCKFHLTQGICHKGDNCIYMHDYPCKYFHTGQTCFAGEKCRFSHEPLTEETKKIIDELMNPSLKEEPMDTDRPKKPSLLGSPPRHILEAMERAKEIKKIPSLFDIEVFPPGQKPKPISFYSERGDSSSPPPDNSPTRPAQNSAPASSAPSPSLLGTPPQNNMRGPNPGGMMQQGPNPMMMAGAQGPMNRPMMGAQRLIFGMQQQGMNTGMQQGMNPNMQQGMNPNMKQAVNANMNQNMMQQGMGPRMQQGMAMNQGMNASMEQNLNKGINPNAQNMQQGMNQGMQQNINQNVQQGMNPAMQQGMNQNMQQNMNQAMQPNMSQNMQQGMNQNVQQGMQQGMNQNMQQGMNQNMQQGMSQNMQQGMNINQGMQKGMNQGMSPAMNQAMQQRMQNPGINPGMMQQAINPNMQQQGMNMNQQGMTPMQGMMNQQGMNPNMRGMNPNIMQGMNRMMSPNMPGIGVPRFGIGAQTAPAMPPVLNMISALLRGSGPGSFNQNGPQGPMPNQGPMMPQDTDSRKPEDADRKNMDSCGQSDNRMSDETSKEGQPGNLQDISSDRGASSLGDDDETVSQSLANPDTNADKTAREEKIALPQHGQEMEAGKPVFHSLQKEASAGESSDEDGMNVLTIDRGSPSPPPKQQLSPENASKAEEEADKGADKDEGMDIARHLPPMQRQLFMRIRQQQLHHDQQQKKEEVTESEESPTVEEKALESKMEEDDNWYSSDEDETGVSKRKLTDILKNISKTTMSSTSGGGTSTVTPASNSQSSTASTINVMQMIQTIRSQAQTSQQNSATPQDLGSTPASASGTPSKDPRQRQTDPDSAHSEPVASSGSAAKSSAVESPSVPLPVLPTLFVDPPVTDGMPKKTLVYRMTPLSVRAVKPYWTLHSSIDIDDPERKDDPRIQAHIALVEKRGPELKNAPPPSKVADPRLARKTSITIEEASGSSPRPVDPRVRRSGGKDPRMGAQDPRSQNMGPQDPRSQNMGPRQEPWMGNNMGVTGVMGPDARMMGPGAGGMNMMQGPNSMGPGFQGNMMQGPRGKMAGQGDMWNMRMGSPMNMQQGTMGMQQGPMGIQQGSINMQGGPMGMNQNPMNMQGGMMNMQGGPMGMQQGPMGMQQGPMGMKDPRRGLMNMQGPVGMQQGNMNMPQGNMGMQQGNVNMPQGNMGMQQGNMNMQQGNMNMQQGNMVMPQGSMNMQQGNPQMAKQQGQGNLQDPRQAVAGSVDPRQTPANQRVPSDPRQRGDQSAHGDPRESRSSSADPRISRMGHDSPQRSPSGVSPRHNDPSVSPSHQQLLDDPVVSKLDSLHNTASSKQSDSMAKDGDSQPGSGSFSLPPALRERPVRSEPDPGANDDGSTSEDSATTKKRFDHRNDPRFKRKRVSENKCEQSETVQENSEEKSRKFMGQRKSSMEYASPLGGGDDIESAGSSYNSYNRPPQVRQDPRKRKTPVNPVSSADKPFDLPRMELPPLLSKQPPPLPENMTPPEMLEEEPEQPEQQLKDLFKTIDPTASPFC